MCNDHLQTIWTLALSYPIWETNQICWMCEHRFSSLCLLRNKIVAATQPAADLVFCSQWRLSLDSETISEYLTIILSSVVRRNGCVPTPNIRTDRLACLMFFFFFYLPQQLVRSSSQRWALPFWWHLLCHCCKRQLIGEQHVVRHVSLSQEFGSLIA